MTTWTTISNAAVAVGAIPSSSIVTALRDNPSAVAESSSGAPVMVSGWHPVDKVLVGDGKTGLIYDHAVTGTVASVVTPDFVDGYEYKLFGSDLSHDNGTAASMVFEMFKQTSGSYANAITTATVISAEECYFEWEILMPRIPSKWHFARWTLGTTSALNPNTVAPAYNATVQKVSKARIMFSAGNIDAGKIWMFRRREYASSP